MFKKELQNFFSSSTAIVIIGVFLCITGLFLFVLPGTYNVFDSGYANLDGLFVLAPWLYLFLIPAVTMRMFSDEYRTGTIDLLLSKPVSPFSLVFSKFLAGMVLVLLCMLPTLFYLLPVSLLGSPSFNMDYGAFWGSFIGLSLIAAAYVAIGLFCSSLTQNQVVSFVMAALLCFFVYYGFELVAMAVDDVVVADKIARLSMSYHYDSLGRGVIDSADVVYFLTVAIIFLLFCYMRIYRRGCKVLVFSLLMLAAANVASAWLFVRVDLTAEKRYSLSNPTRNLLQELKTPVKVDLYLTGDANVGFHRLFEAVRDMLREMDAYSGGGIAVELHDPAKAASNEERNNRYARLQAAGMKPTAVYERDNSGNMQQKLVFPWAVMSMGGDSVNIALLKNIPGHSGDENLNISVESLEYELSDALRRLSNDNPSRVAFIEGHGEWDEAYVYDITLALSAYYHVDRGTLSGKAGELSPYKVIIIAAPVKPFKEYEKFVIDQYIMKGGRVLWLVDGVMSSDNEVLYPLDVNLSDQLFTYGARINPYLLLDTDCLLVPINVAFEGEPAQFEPAPWYYSPLLAGNEGNPVCKNLSQVKADFCSAVDFVGQDSLRRDVLLYTTGRTAVETVPSNIRYNVFDIPVTTDFFAYTHAPVAVALEGVFRSVFANRLLPEGAEDGGQGIVRNSADTKMIVVADGDIIRNDVVSAADGVECLPLGYDRYGERIFSNKDFVLNCVNYLADDDGWMQLRARELKLRLLNKEAVSAERLMWQILCLAVPLALLVGSCVAYALLRRRRYAA